MHARGGGRVRIFALCLLDSVWMWDSCVLELEGSCVTAPRGQSQERAKRSESGTTRCQMHYNNNFIWSATKSAESRLCYGMGLASEQQMNLPIGTHSSKEMGDFDPHNKPDTKHTKSGYGELLVRVETHTRELRGRDKDTTL